MPRTAKTKPAPVEPAPAPPKTKAEIIDDLAAILRSWIEMEARTLESRVRLAREHLESIAATLAPVPNPERARRAALDVEPHRHGESIERSAAKLHVITWILRDLENNRDHLYAEDLVRMLADRVARDSLNESLSPVGVGDPFHAASIHVRRFGRSEARRDLASLLADATKSIREAPESREEDH